MTAAAICWYSAFALGALSFLCGIVYLLSKKGIREEHFARAAVFEFAASWIMYIPEELYHDTPESLPALHVLESVLTALLRTFNIYLGNDFRRAVFEGHPVFSGFCNNEYNRHSVYARTLSFKYKVQIIDEFYGGDYAITGQDKSIWKVYEHMRWNVYTRTLGYITAPKKLLNADGTLDKGLRGIAKVHNDLVDFADLPEKEQKKDELKQTDEIVAILKSI